jgi:hypothetical protein
MANYCTACHNPIESREIKDKTMLPYHPACLKRKQRMESGKGLEQEQETEESDFAI